MKLEYSGRSAAGNAHAQTRTGLQLAPGGRAFSTENHDAEGWHTVCKRETEAEAEDEVLSRVGSVFEEDLGLCIHDCEVRQCQLGQRNR